MVIETYLYQNWTVIYLHPVPNVTTNTATNVTQNSATLNGTVNANNQSTTVWFDYGETSGSYDKQSSTETLAGSSNTAVSITISGLSPATTYYYRIAAESDAGTSYGDEMSFTTLPDTTIPTGYTQSLTMMIPMPFPQR